MNTNLKQALINKLLGMADDELILAHRNSEWTGHAPILEEDIAFSNIAQDELGHATLWYTLVAELHDENPESYPDQLAFFREPSQFCNVQLVELPIGDWAFSILRQYFFDVAEMLHLKALTQSKYQAIADIAAKVQKEEIYHYRHSAAWLKRLGLGTPESHRRIQDALNTLWPYANQLFVPWPDESLLGEAGFFPELNQLKTDWQAMVTKHLTEAELIIPQNTNLITAQRTEHSKHLSVLLTEMQEVARLETPQTAW